MTSNTTIGYVTYDLLANIPASSEEGTYFLATDTGALYIWNVSAWVLLGAGGTGPTGPTGSTGATGPTGAGSLAQTVAVTDAWS